MVVYVSERMMGMNPSPRLRKILLLVLKSDKSVPAGDLAEYMQVSKRTVFRELENVGGMIAKYGLQLETKSKKGISISGTQENKGILLNALNQSEFVDPKNMEERQKRIIFELLNREEPQKIYLFSKLLQVSEGTVNYDLDVIDKWFGQSGVGLIRKRGLGIYLEYQEEDYRKACMMYVHQDSNGADQRMIYDALIKREGLSTQMIPEYGLLFLHAKTAAVKESVFVLIRAEDGGFTQELLKAIKCVVVMLIPEEHSHNKLAVSAISTAIFESDKFLESIKYGDEFQVRQGMEHILNNYLTGFISNYKP